MISIIIPTLNEESVLDRTLSRLQAGFSLPHEVIISDGMSKDRTGEIARRYTDKVAVHDGSHRQTIAEGRNTGAALASADSKYLAFMDADCTIFEQDKFFGQLIAHFERDPRLVAANVAIRVLPEYETWPDWVVFNTFNAWLWLANNVLRLGISAGEFQMFRKSDFEKVGGYNPALVAAEDVDLFQRLRKLGKVRYERGLTIYHTGRRAHKMGWPKLLWLWVMNPLMMMIRGRAHSKEWVPIR